MDGVDNSDEISGYAHQSPALDSIQEIQVLVNGFKAEYGQASGGVVNVITRSGTNQLAAAGFFLFQDENLRSRSPYANRSLPDRSPSSGIQYGATVGGPIRSEPACTSSPPTSAMIATPSRHEHLHAADGDAGRRAAPSTLQFLSSTRHRHRAVSATGGRQRLVRPEYVDVHKATARLDHQHSAEPEHHGPLPARRRTIEPSGMSGTLLRLQRRPHRRSARDYFNFNHKWVLGANKLNEAYVQYGKHHEDINAIFTTFPTRPISGAFDARVQAPTTTQSTTRSSPSATT